MNLLVKNVHIVTADSNSDVKNGCIAIEGKKIVYIGDVEFIPHQFNPYRTIDGQGKLALPGLINAHTHSAMVLFRGLFNDKPLNDWLASIWPLEDMLTPQDTYWLSCMAIAEMIREGITTFADMYMFMNETALAAHESGVRAVLARGLVGVDKKSDLRLNEAKTLWKEWDGRSDGRIKVMIGPHALYTCDREYLGKCIELAHELDAMIHIHAAETAWEFDNCMELYDKTPIEYLNDVGLFELKTLAAHCVHLTDEDIDILLDKNVSVAHCPSSNMKLASGFAPVVDLMKLGVNVALGTDSAASNNNLSIVKEMNLASLIHKGFNRDATAVSARQALQMATQNAAIALGLEDRTGVLSEGMSADIILVDTNLPHYFPISDPVVGLVYAGSGNDVDTVIVDGRVVMENREIKTMDIEKIKFEVNRIAERVLQRR